MAPQDLHGQVVQVDRPPELVRDLSDREFKQLVRCSREDFRTFCVRADVLQQVNGAALPVGLYAFWPQIMDAPVDQVRERAARLTRAPKSQAWVPLPDD